jgi:hypothetical protein
MRQTNLDIYGNAPIEWSRATEQLDSAHRMLTYWLATTRPDGRPHAAGVGAMWVDGRFWFTSGPSRQKSRNLAASGHCVLSVSLPGIDLIANGTAAKVADEATVARLAERYAANGWPAVAQGSSFTAPFSAPSAGPPPWDLYEMTLVSAIGVASAEPYGATRWDFD